jgi:hypothetical protein
VDLDRPGNDGFCDSIEFCGSRFRHARQYAIRVPDAKS